MAVEITIQLYPPAGGGVQILNTPQGPIPVPVPFLEYTLVREIIYQDLQLGIRFINRAGEDIETNVKYLIKRTNVAEGSA